MVVLAHPVHEDVLVLNALAALVGDESRLRQILLNLLSNSLKFTDSGEVSLTVTAERETEGPVFKVCFAVRDTGIGIPADRMDRLFRSFSQTDSSISRRYGGTARGSYEFFPKFTGNVAFTAEKYEYPELGTYTRRFLVDSGLSYLLPHGVTVSLYYKYINYYSPGIASDNKEVNRGILEVRKVF